MGYDLQNNTHNDLNNHIDIDMEIDMDIDINIEEIYTYVLSQWSEISKNHVLMSNLDIKKNKTCIRFKDVNPDEEEHIIQAKTFTMMFYTLLFLAEQ